MLTFIFTLNFAITCMISTVLAQQSDELIDDHKKFYFSLKGGYSTSFYFSTEKGTMEQTRFNHGFHVALRGGHILTDLLAIQTDLMVTTRGAQVSVPLPTERFEEDYSLYFTQPISLRIGNEHWYALAGVYWGIVLIKGDWFSGDTMMRTGTTVNTFDMGAQIGGGYKWNNGLFIESTFDMGFLPAIETRNLVGDDVYMYNWGILVSVGYLLPFGG